MATLEELAERLAVVEDRLSTVEHLRGLMDGDLGTVAAQTKATSDVVKALALDMGEMKTALRGHTRDLAELKAGQGAIVGLLEELIRRDDERRLGDEGIND